MTKRRKVLEIFEEVEKINNWEPSKKDLEELAEVLNEVSRNNSEELPREKIASTNKKDDFVNIIEHCRIQSSKFYTPYIKAVESERLCPIIFQAIMSYWVSHTARFL